MENRITVLLGAGAMIDATGVTTMSLTRKVLDNCKSLTINDNDSRSIVDTIYKQLLKSYKSDVLNISFEDIYHVLEIIPSFKSSSTYKGLTSAMKIIAHDNQTFKDVKMSNVYASAHEFINTINDEIATYDPDINLEKNKWFKDFFINLSEKTNKKWLNHKFCGMTDS